MTRPSAAEPPPSSRGGHGAGALAARNGDVAFIFCVCFGPNIGFSERGFVQFAGPVASLDLQARLVPLQQAKIRIVVQEIAKRFFAISDIFGGVENVVMPEGVDVQCRCRLLAGENGLQVQETPVFLFHGLGRGLAPALAKGLMCQLKLDRTKVQLFDCCIVFDWGHDKPLLVRWSGQSRSWNGRWMQVIDLHP